MNRSLLVCLLIGFVAVALGTEPAPAAPASTATTLDKKLTPGEGPVGKTWEDLEAAKHPQATPLTSVNVPSTMLKVRPVIINVYKPEDQQITPEDKLPTEQRHFIIFDHKEQRAAAQAAADAAAAEAEASKTPGPKYFTPMFDHEYHALKAEEAERAAQHAAYHALHQTEPEDTRTDAELRHNNHERVDGQAEAVESLKQSGPAADGDKWLSPVIVDDNGNLLHVPPSLHAHYGMTQEQQLENTEEAAEPEETHVVPEDREAYYRRKYSGQAYGQQGEQVGQQEGQDEAAAQAVQNEQEEQDAEAAQQTTSQQGQQVGQQGQQSAQQSQQGEEDVEGQQGQVQQDTSARHAQQVEAAQERNVIGQQEAKAEGQEGAAEGEEAAEGGLIKIPTAAEIINELKARILSLEEKLKVDEEKLGQKGQATQEGQEGQQESEQDQEEEGQQGQEAAAAPITKQEEQEIIKEEEAEGESPAIAREEAADAVREHGKTLAEEEKEIGGQGQGQSQQGQQQSQEEAEGQEAEEQSEQASQASGEDGEQGGQAMAHGQQGQQGQQGQGQESLSSEGDAVIEELSSAQEFIRKLIHLRQLRRA